MKNTMKKALSLFLVLVLCFSTLIFTADAEDTAYTESYYTYIIEDGGATIIYVDEAISGDVVVPETLGGYPVKKIVDSFVNCYYITGVVIPDTVEVIDDSFDNCKNIQEVYLPYRLREITDFSFFACGKLKEVIIPNSIEVLSGFHFCSSLESISFKEGYSGNRLKEIDDYAFEFCWNLKKVELPDGLETIGEEAFNCCISLSSVRIPESVSIIKRRAFHECNSLKTIIVLSESVDFTDCGIGLTDVDFKEITAEEYAQLWLIVEELSSDLAIAEKEKDFETYEEKNNQMRALEGEMENSLVLLGSFQPIADATIYGFKNSTAEAYANAYGINFENILEKETVYDSAVNIEAEFNKGTFPKNVNIKVTEGGENANFVFGGLFSRYASYDISFESNGKEVQPNGTVKIRIKLPLSFNSKSTKVYYVDENSNKTQLYSEYVDGYIVFETDHFSEYVLVDESSKIETPTEPDEPTTEPDEPSDNCSHICHETGFMSFIWKILRFFFKLFGSNPVCECGMKHY